MTAPCPAPCPGREIVLVVARAENGVIGRDGGLPWHIPEDLKRFRALTTGTAMVMGRKTFESLPGLLPGRRHIVVTRDRGWSATGAEVAHSLDEALALALAGGAHVSVIGGADIFAQAEPLADRIELTEVFGPVEGDTVLAPFGDGWREAAREGRECYAFVTFVRTRR